MSTDLIKKFSVLVSIAMVLVLGVLDCWTGYEMSFSLFYLLPISLFIWQRRIHYGIGISILCSVIWFFADALSGHPYSQDWILYWTALARFAVFIIVTCLLDKVKKDLEFAKRLSHLDLLTGLNTTRSFLNQARIEKNKFARFKRPFALAYFDIDNFKQVNDSFGHA